MSGPSLAYEALSSYVFTLGLTSTSALAALLHPLVPQADGVALVFALVLGFLTAFTFLLSGSYVNPAVALIDLVKGRLRPLRFAALAAVELASTVAAVASVAALCARYPLPGGRGRVPPPGPPPAHADPALVALAEFAIALATFGAGAAAQSLGPLLAPFAASAAYVALAFAENGRFSGAIINPAAVLALHVYSKDVTQPRVWAQALGTAAPYLAGILAAAVAFAGAQRMAAARKRKAE